MTTDNTVVINHADEAYANFSRAILENGIIVPNRTGVSTKAIYGHMAKYDLAKGFPLLTTKRVHWKSVVYELLWFLRGESNVKWLKDHGVTIWDEWQKTDFGVGGPSSERPIVFVDRRRVSNHSSLTGTGPSWSIDEDHTVGSTDYRLHNTWRKMMRRCYDTTHHHYPSYGGSGIFVDARWHSCKNFVEDVKNLPNWSQKLEDWLTYELDKDYYGSNAYSPETCVWLHKEENKLYRRNSAPIKVGFPDKTTRIFLSLKHVESELGIPSTTLYRRLNDPPSEEKGNNKLFNVYSFNYVDVPSDKVVRMAFSRGELGPVYGVQWMRWPTPDGRHINQIQEAINLIRKSPNSRRIIVTAWNPSDVPNMALPPCHTHFQFHVDTVANRIHLSLYMRSLDTFLGCPFNVASYALLLSMIAHITGYSPGVLTHFVGDAHFYTNHFDQINEQLSRTSFAPPTVRFDPAVKEIDQFTFESIELLDYKHHPPIKAPVAV